MASNIPDPADGFDWQTREHEVADVVDLGQARARRTDRPPDITPDGPADTGPDTGTHGWPDTTVAASDNTDTDAGVPGLAEPKSASDGSDFRFELDDEPDGVAETVDVRRGFVANIVNEATKVPIIPDAFRRRNLKRTAERALGLAGHHTLYHTVRLPLYVAQTAFWGVVGAFKLAGRQITWWWVTEQFSLRQAMANGRGTREEAETWAKLHREVKATRTWRASVLTGEVVLLAAGSVMLAVAPWWAQALTGGIVGPLLARFGKPTDRRIITSAVISPRFRVLTLDVVLRAYYAAGLGNPDREDKRVSVAPPGAARDGDGTRIVIDLPYGKGFDDAVKARQAIASGLDVAVSQVFLTADPSSHRRHVLWVADRDPLAIPAGSAPILDAKPTDVWASCPFGLDERGQRVWLEMLFKSFLIGAQPRKGKTFSARLIALYAALDPYVVICGADGKLSPDWNSFPLIAHRWVFGVNPNPRDRDPIAHLIDMLEEVKAHIEEVNDFLSGLPTGECPEGKLTRELSRRYPQLRVWLLIMEEFQKYFETVEQDDNKRIAGLLSDILATGPSAGVILVSSSQKPSGVGAGDVSRLFTRYRDNHDVRFALKCGNRVVSEAILGGDAYTEGFDASSLPSGKAYRGVGILYGAADETPTVRTYLADAADAEHILTAARAHRERLGLLSGHAAGQALDRARRDFLADLRSIFNGVRALHWASIAERLASALPESYAQITPDAVSAQARALGVTASQIKIDGTNRQGCYVADLDKAIAGRRG